MFTGRARSLRGVLVHASHHFPVKEDTPSDASSGHQLYQGLKERFAAELKPRYIFNLVMKFFGANESRLSK